MKNTIENKQRFFALYFNPKRIVFRRGFNNRSNLSPTLIDKDDRLELKPLSQITDEDKIFLIKNEFYSHVKFDNPSPLELWRDEEVYKSQYAIDFLRGNGYALDYTTPEGETITVREMEDFGWIKIKE